ncbi:uncharacterized protein LOC131429891 [Malaya genurostris]|uniref:uncharacterized protein LOC131429891 n=1 Tax=Malaya genurostris TaxID=325434 RepID=UPI0026F3E88D|nr:uncharacterized protein LOC131429891 [Malaya genurostris]
MAHRTEKSLDEQQLMSPSEVHRELMHSAREADRSYVASGGEDSAGDVSILQLDESYGADLDADDVDAEFQYDEYEDVSGADFDVDDFLAEIQGDWREPVEEEIADSTIESIASEDLVPQELKDILEDSYFPGFLDDVVEGKLPYNGQVIVEDGNVSSVKETTLLEAFDQRVEHEQQQIKERVGITEVRGSPLAGGQAQTSSPAREEDVSTALAGIRIDQKIRNVRETQLNAAIANLTKAQVISDYQIKLNMMKEMTKRAVGRMSTSVSEKEEEAGAAPVGSKYPKFEVYDSGAGDSMKPLEIISYIGSTRNKM